VLGITDVAVKVGSLAFWSLVIEETSGDRATPQSVVSDDDHRLATAKFCRLLREFLGLPTDDRP